jgi:deoxycytidylate deaminase
MEDIPPPMRIAIKESNKSRHRQQLGAAIVRGKRVLSKACNMKKTCPEFGSGEYCYLHAEGNAIKKAVRRGIDLSGASIYVYRKNNGLAKPCPSCMVLIEKYNIIGVYYSGKKS